MKHAFKSQVIFVEMFILPFFTFFEVGFLYGRSSINSSLERDVELFRSMGLEFLKVRLASD